jgi:hypothetical protein
MANILDAAAQGTRKTVTGAARTAKEAVMDQFDPRGSLYKLGLGVGPIIRQTVAEYKKQQGSGSKSTDKKQKDDVVDIKKVSKTTASSLSGMNAQLRSMNALLKDIRSLSTAQLKAQNQISKNAGDNRPYASSPSSLGSLFANDNKNEKAGDKGGMLSSLGDLLSGNLGTIAKAGLGVAAGGLIYKNKDEIKNFLEDFLKGAGLPSSDELSKQLNTQIKETAKDVGTAVGGAIVQGVKEAFADLSPTISKYVKEGLGVGTDAAGKDLPLNKKNLGGMTGASMGFLAGKKMGGWTGGVLGGVGGFFGGEQYSEESIGLATLGAGLYGSYKGVGALNRLGAARAANAAQAVTPSAPAAATAAPWQVPTNAPSSPLRVGERMTAGGIVIPGDAGGRSVAQQAKMDRLANGQLTSMEKAGVRVKEAVSAVGDAGKQAGSIFSKYGGKLLGALNVAMTLPQIYDDIENGDYAAAGMEAMGLVGSIGSAALTPFITPAGAAAVGFGVTAASSYAAGKLRTPKTTGASITETDTTPTPQTNNAKPTETPSGLQPEASGEARRSLLTLKFSDLTEEEKSQILGGQAKAEGWYPGSMSFRNNNPGNLKFANWMKEFGGAPGDTASDGGQFARFPSKQAGLMAQRRQWERPLYANLTIAQGLKQWHTSTNPVEIANYAKTVASGSGIDVGNVNSPMAVTAGATAAGVPDTPMMIQTRSLKSMGLKDDQIAALQGFQETIRGFNDFSNMFTGNFDSLPGNAVAASPAAPSTPTGGNSSKTPPSVPPVSIYKEKHSFGQPWYKTGGAIPTFQ